MALLSMNELTTYRWSFEDDFGNHSSQPQEVHVTVGVSGLLSPVSTSLVLEDHAAPLPGKAFKQGRTVPLKLQLLCGDSQQTDQDVQAPEIVGLVREGDAPLDLATVDLDPGAANDSGTFFRFADGAWIYNLDTVNLPSGIWSLLIEMPDARRFRARLVLK